MRQCMDSENLHRRLKKIIGQVQAIDRMVDEDVPCEDILSQLTPPTSALHKCGQVVLEGISDTACATASNTATRSRPSPASPSGGAVRQHEVNGRPAAAARRVSILNLTTYTPIGIL